MASLDPDTLEPIGVVTIWLCSQHHRAMLDAIRNQRTMPHGWVR
jgi:hypothetical protein